MTTTTTTAQPTTTPPSTKVLLTLKNRTTRIRTLCPFSYLIREDFLFGGREGLTARDEIHRRIRAEIMPTSETIMAYDLIRTTALPWMAARDYPEGYCYLLFYCTTHDPLLQHCFMDQACWLYPQHPRLLEEEQAHVQPDVEQFEALRKAIRESVTVRDLQDRDAAFLSHGESASHQQEPEPPLPEFIIRRRGETERVSEVSGVLEVPEQQQQQQPTLPSPPTAPPAVSVPSPRREPQQPQTKPRVGRSREEEQEADEARNFLIKERELLNLLSEWRGRIK